eukprot:CAMPEP_0170743956 /NCGR_PEP_ID=MMETSP0437-20130122/7533_1 /TAXON_ID=0 /ORGANISM="Sexangularia sp." /LENGTH=80 /DNA_ID=CAMNT_0011082637 /DNA_START=233 /DNA_END=475 /DNA_ORIENTATION=+
MFPRLDWPALVAAAAGVGIGIPTEPMTFEQVTATADVYQNVVKVLMSVDVEEGSLTCPACQRVFPITDGIPKMIIDVKDD